MCTAKDHHLKAIAVALAKERRPERLALDLCLHIEALRSLYRNSPRDLTQVNIEYLKRVVAIAEAVEDYGDLLEDIRTARDLADYEALLQDLSDALAVVGEAAISDRIRRDQRSLSEKLGQFEKYSQARDDTARIARMKLLERRTMLLCQWCSVRMVVCESEFGLFWGCPRFPAADIRLGLVLMSASS